MRMTSPAVSEDTTRKKMTNVVDVATSVVETGQKLFGMGKTYWRQHFAYSVTISEKDSLYGDVFDWLLLLDPNEKHRALQVFSSRNPRGDEPVSVKDSPEKIKPLIIRFDEGTEKNITLDGHPVHISVFKPELNEKSLRDFEPAYSKIEFLVRTQAAQKAVLELLERINTERSTTRKAVLKMVNAWNQWTTRSDLPARTMASVHLPPDQKKRIIEDLGGFLAAEEQYNRLAIPWHRGYMFEGPPGTGKTSLVKALANHFNLDLWYISLSDLKAEAGLIGLLAEVGPRSLLLLEDIDTIQIAKDRDNNEQGKISLSSLLNTLDGVATPHGLITMMTTNRIEALDDALTRAGRMDMIEHLGYPTVQTLSDMYKHFYSVRPRWTLSRQFDDTTPLEGLSTAQVAEIMKRHLDDPKGASKAIVPLINKAGLSQSK